MTPLPTSLVISTEQSEAFARLSGDFNPLHLDPVIARRTQFGGPVVHGVHLILASLDQLLEPARRAHRVTVLKAWFQGALAHGETLVVSVEGKDQVHLSGSLTNGSSVFRAVVELADSDAAIELPGDSFTPAAASDLTISDAESAAGKLELSLDSDRTAALFPRLFESITSSDLAVILATTRLVGMHCPGLHSVYTRLDLKASGNHSPSTELEWKVERLHRGLGQTRMAVAGAGLAGQVEALFRPESRTQISFSDARSLVEQGQTEGHRALVIGGSRGLGEVFAKLLAAGGAEVTVTFRLGREDAHRVRDELRHAGASAWAEELDVGALSGNLSPPPAMGRPTHLYYFATPPIGRLRSARFDQSKFHTMCAIYVDGLINTLEAIEKWWPDGGDRPQVFYPSTEFLDNDEAVATEYCAAKAAAETVCRQLSAAKPATACFVARLPRVATDQTLGVASGAMPDAAPAAVEALCAFLSWSRGQSSIS